MEHKINLSETSLATDINNLSREILHDFFVVCRKAGIYSVHHPMVNSAVPRPFLGMQKIFGFKKYFSLILNEGRLYANNIIVTDAAVVDYLKEKMHDLEIESILFEDTVGVSDLETFIDRFVKRMATNSPDYFMHKFLESRNVYSIHVNSDLAGKLFSTGLRYHKNIGEDFSVRSLVADYFSGDPHLAVTVISSRFEDTGEQAKTAGIDYRVDLVNHILPEKFTRLQSSEFLDMADQILGDGAVLDDTAGVRMERLIRSLDYHPRRDELIEDIRKKFVERGIDEELLDDSLSRIGSLKHEAANTVDRILDRMFSPDFETGLSSQFRDAFMRLVRTRQMGKAASAVEKIVDRLASPDSLFRQRAVAVLEDIVAAAIASGEHDFLDVILRHIQALFTDHRETYETSPVVGLLLRSMVSLRRFEPVAEFLDILRAGRRLQSGVAVYESLTVKRVFADLDQPDIVSRLVKELELPGNRLLKPVQAILAAIQSVRVAVELASIVTHPERSVRQQCLKTLTELGWPAVNVFSDIVRDEANFVRPDGRNELPDNQWFLVRNAIFVLGRLGDQAACSALRLRLGDPDIRIRREIVRALERIGGDQAIDFLMILADDLDPEIRESAVIALGIFREPDLVPFFIDQLSRHKTEIKRIIIALGLAGSPEAREFLTEIKNDREKLKSYASGNASVSEISKWVDTALTKSNDDECSPRDRALTADESSDGRSALSKTARLFIDKFYPRK